MTDEQLYIARQEGQTYQQIAATHNLNTDSVRGRISRYARHQQTIINLQLKKAG